MRTLLMLLFCSMVYFSNAQTVLLNFDASKSCVDKYEYAKDGSSTSDYLVFYYSVSNEERIILETGIEYTPRNKMPNRVLNCEDFQADENFVNSLNNGTLEMAIILKHNSGYRLYKVKKAAYYFNTAEAFGTSTKSYAFTHQYAKPSTSNIASQNSRSDVFFKEKDRRGCLDHYKFKTVLSTSTASGPRILSRELMILPEIGVLYKKTEPVPPAKNGSILELQRINNHRIQDYMALVCKYYEGTVADVGRGNSAKPTHPTSTTTGTSTTHYPSMPPASGRIYMDLDKGYYVDSHTGQRANGEFGGNTYNNGHMVNKNPRATTSTTTTTIDPPTKVSTTRRIHIVQKGENLYRIALNNNTSVENIQALNNLGRSLLIQPGQRLIIAE